MTKFGIGQPVPRSEDTRLLRGAGRYTDDVRVPGQKVGYVLRSPHAYAAIRGIDTADAATMPGIHAIFTAQDLKQAGIKDIPCVIPLRVRAGTTLHMKHRPVLADGFVSYGGEPVAFIVADSLYEAMDAADAVMVDYDALDAVVDTAAALSHAVTVHDDVPGNLVYDWEKGNQAATDAAFAKAARIVRLDLINNRLSANPLEGRACVAEYDAAADVTRLTVGSQGVHDMRDMLAGIFGEDAARFHVLTHEVGGGFGMKLFCYPEYVLACFAARRVGAAVAWTSSRAEAFLSDDHGRDNVSVAELALDPDGRILALRADIIANMGAYLSNYATYIQTDGQTKMLSGVYAIPAIYARVRGVYTHTQPVDAYRGAGRPEAAYLVERLIDKAAREIGQDPADFRRLNMIPPSAMPYRTPMGHIYDSGDFAGTLDAALDRADRDGFPARRARALAQGRLLGLGIATYIEACSGGAPEAAELLVKPDGSVLLLIGTQSNGQGHETAYKQVIAEVLGIAPDAIVMVQGDSQRVKSGGGTGGSRSIPTGGVAVRAGAADVITQARPVAARLLEADEDSVRFEVTGEGGGFAVAGSNRFVPFADVAAAATPDADGHVFRGKGTYSPPSNTFPNGTHVVEISVEIDTGVPRIERYTVVDDFGTVLNPLLLEGQVHGGIAQGMGQALLELIRFDRDSGQLLTGSFMDYAMPRADHLPMIDFSLRPVPCTTNPLGLKGAGEAGAIGACPAIINALVDALAGHGVTHVEMPATAPVLWRLIHSVKAATAA
ncbi:xanthine dehydrogenase family protein molybdopterin-binding subunit [Niveispirillum sp.]|uniref:xanthine dehydrogenase family protein molybdopterin-binding subunit n=1 Tax=Niveispirillum sp. TaxID=1917217 RepID=UPI001B5CD91A|nr:xanthine dehydrogenase family protein molybdopterin-binding subunit [Niveispirillum sp.]MBP7336597.1 xanthine dehydrogenase family protein molybdopterin-binding subunit [Niveispirillum sp.]